ncbi:PREDICTED: coiled-coil domain-containing protein 65 [Dufourea novaeangliae]|uniref:Dynein regulatory complex subunit 2 n=1 Tax=Dufourea novaeangliae TaxID=178035 RepID=A0A154P1M4_DUFNO|nr:PREDICTED: coiled-coil domain-containing protein 65 [Dufourea novaeangliae]KZC05030.1 Coiled-coil domain-containing protein 65 [Dufourea novaeangliae]
MPPKRKRRGLRVKPINVRDSKRKALDREIKFNAMNTERHLRLWREILVRMEMPDIWKKVEIIWESLEHALDVKDYSISLLLDALQETEDQRRKTNGVHTEVIDRSLRAHGSRLEAVDTFFHGHIETIFVDKTHEFEDINYSRNKDETTLRKINVLINYRSENKLTIAKSTAISKVNAFVDDGKNERRLVTAQLQKQLEDLGDKLRSVFSDYRTNTDERRKAYEIIQRKDKSDRQAIIEQNLRIACLLDEIAKFREKIHSYRRDVANELHDIRRESYFFRNTYRQATKCFVSDHKKDKQRTMTMSSEYNCTAKQLRDLTMKAGRMLTYMQTCRKYETQDEKILPVIVDHHVHATLDDVLPFDLVTEDFQTLIRFWQRFGFSQLIAAELRIERNLYATEANNLRKSVKHFFRQASYSMFPSSQ